MKKVAINGTSGFLGSALCEYLAKDFTVVKIRRSDYFLDAKSLGVKLESVDIVINLAGSSISRRWTESYKREIFLSRIDTTRHLVSAIRGLKHKPELVISFSAIGIYDDIHAHDENSCFFAKNFLRDVCAAWEEEISKICEFGVDLAICRLGIVLDTKNGFMKRVLFPFTLGLGVWFGDGRQYFSFISRNDFLRAIDFIIAKHICGIVNLSAPKASTNFEFGKSLAVALHRPFFLKIPSFFVKVLFGEQSLLFLGGQNVIPKVLTDNGFSFTDQTLEESLYHLINGY